MYTKHIKISDIPPSEICSDRMLLFCQFLDDFKHENKKGKEALLAEEPLWKNPIEDIEMFYMLAATAHHLSNQEGLVPPAWCMDKKYVAPTPVYLLNTKNVKYQEWLKINTLPEFAERNLFWGQNIVERR